MWDRRRGDRERDCDANDEVAEAIRERHGAGGGEHRDEERPGDVHARHVGAAEIDAVEGERRDGGYRDGDARAARRGRDGDAGDGEEREGDRIQLRGEDGVLDDEGAQHVMEAARRRAGEAVALLEQLRRAEHVERVRQDEERRHRAGEEERRVAEAPARWVERDGEEQEQDRDQRGHLGARARRERKERDRGDERGARAALEVLVPEHERAEEPPQARHLVRVGGVVLDEQRHDRDQRCEDCAHARRSEEARGERRGERERQDADDCVRPQQRAVVAREDREEGVVERERSHAVVRGGGQLDGLLGEQVADVHRDDLLRRDDPAQEGADRDTAHREAARDRIRLEHAVGARVGEREARHREAEQDEHRQSPEVGERLAFHERARLRLAGRARGEGRRPMPRSTRPRSRAPPRRTSRAR